jgi:hypothetical protein
VSRAWVWSDTRWGAAQTQIVWAGTGQRPAALTGWGTTGSATRITWTCLSLRMKQLTKNELHELDRLWTQLARAVVYDGPPMTDDQMTAAALDPLLAGVISSAGRMDRHGVALFEAILSERAHSPALQSILDRIAAVLGLGGDDQGVPHS